MEKIFLDLNIDGDCTNLGALAVLNVLANNGKAEILGTTACFKSPLATGCIKAINEYYGNGYLPVGILHRQDETHPTPFMKPVNENFRPDAPDGEDAPDTVGVMRRVLSLQDDNSVTLVITGCFASFEALLKSGEDEHSPLSGQLLAEKKIKRVVVMGGSFDTFGDVPFGENNIAVQIPAAKYVTQHWKKELVLSAYEIGIRTTSLKEFRLHGSRSHPLQMMYEINDGDGFKDGNPSWDHTAVLEGALPGEYFNYHEYGEIEITDDGHTVWHEKEGGKHTYLLPKTPLDDVAAVINDLIFPQWREYK
ncbi:MAG: nucleoside hydrolase [Clostridia bacterium]|nr:nucleoside hydrolase [Clostridia bacterium]